MIVNNWVVYSLLTSLYPTYLNKHTTNIHLYVNVTSTTNLYTCTKEQLMELAGLSAIQATKMLNLRKKGQMDMNDSATVLAQTGITCSKQKGFR